MAKEQYGFSAFGAEGPGYGAPVLSAQRDLGDGQAVGRDRSEAAKAVILLR